MFIAKIQTGNWGDANLRAEKNWFCSCRQPKKTEAVSVSFVVITLGQPTSTKVLHASSCCDFLMIIQ